MALAKRPHDPDSEETMTRRLMSASLLMMSSFVGGAGCLPSSSDDGKAGGARAATSKGDESPIPTSGRFERRQRIDMAADGLTFKRTELGELPEEYALTADGRSFWLISFGEADIRCGTMERSAQGVSFDADSNERCGFASHYEPGKTGALVYERRERIDLKPGGLTRSVLDPSTGSILGAHPETFIVEGNDVYTTLDATGEKQQKCGSISVFDGAAHFKGCGLWQEYAESK